MFGFFGFEACGVLAPQPGIALALLPALEAQGLNHLAIREVLNVGIQRQRLICAVDTRSQRPLSEL